MLQAVLEYSLKFRCKAIAPAGSTANHASIPSVVGAPKAIGEPRGGPSPSGAFISPVWGCIWKPVVGLSPGMAPAGTQPPCPLSIPTLCRRSASTKSLIRIHNNPMGTALGSLAILSVTTISTSLALSTVISKSSFQRSVLEGWDFASCVPSTLRVT